MPSPSQAVPTTDRLTTAEAAVSRVVTDPTSLASAPQSANQSVAPNHGWGSIPVSSTPMVIRRPDGIAGRSAVRWATTTGGGVYARGASNGPPE